MTTDSKPDLVTFLNARLDEDEYYARSATMQKDNRDSKSWRVDPEPWAYGTGIVDGTRDGKGGVAVAPGSHKADHIARHDPARVLREVEAKRKILAEHARGYPTTYPEPSGQPTCGTCHCGGWDWEPCDWPCGTVLALAAVYSDHPDYRQERA